MSKTRIINGRIFSVEGVFVEKDLYMAGERLCERGDFLKTEGETHIVDAAGAYVIPGLTDIHFHGCMGSDCCDATPAALRVMARYELSQGITGITPATMTMPGDVLRRIAVAAKEYAALAPADAADLLGLYMEGPFINPLKKGAQNAADILPPDTGLLHELQSLSGHLFRTAAVAPEMPGALDFIRENAADIRITLAHTAADYDTASQALQSGASQLTHLFNAMPGLMHRAPGPIAAAADTDHTMVELICDGIHVHPAMVRLALRLFTDSRVIFISDSMRACGLQDGTYDLGGQTVHVQGSLATLADGTLAGSVTNLMQCMKKAVLDMGIPLESAVKCAAVNPVRSIGLTADHGSLEPGKYANIVLLDQDLQVKQIFHRGRQM